MAKELTKEETTMPEGITKGYARWVIDEWKAVVAQIPLAPTIAELNAMDEQESAA